MRSDKTSRIRLTLRGKRLIYSLLIAGILGSALLDPPLIFIAIITGVFASHQYLQTRRRLSSLRDQLSVNPSKINAASYADQTIRGEFSMESSSGSKLSIGSELLNLRFTPDTIEKGVNKITYEFNSSLSGEYTSNEIQLELCDRFKLFKGERALGFEASFRVYPRVYAVALEALDFLSGFQGEGLGDDASKGYGEGLEYAETREYIPGDQLKRLDWRAIARTGRLMVKTYYKDIGGGAHILFDPTAPDPVSRDKLAASFLRIVLGFAESDATVDLSVLKGDEVEFSGKGLRSVYAVLAAMNHALRQVGSGFNELFAVLDPAPSTKLKTLIQTLSIRTPPSRCDFMELVNGSRNVILVSSLIGDPVTVLELSQLVKASGGSMLVLQPTTPWRQASDLEDAYRIWRHYEKLDSLSSREKIVIINDVDEYRQYNMLNLLTRQNY